MGAERQSRGKVCKDFGLAMFGKKQIANAQNLYEYPLDGLEATYALQGVRHRATPAAFPRRVASKTGGVGASPRIVGIYVILKYYSAYYLFF